MYQLHTIIYGILLVIRFGCLLRHRVFLVVSHSEQITKQQAHIDRLYVSLKDLVEQRKTKLEQQYWLYQLKREVEALEKWITEREAVASSTELGGNLEHVTVSHTQHNVKCLIC